MIRGPAGFSPAAGEKEIEFCPDQEQESASEPQNGWAAPNLRPLRAPRGTAGGKNEDDHDNDANNDGDDDMNNPLSPPPSSAQPPLRADIATVWARPARTAAKIASLHPPPRSFGVFQGQKTAPRG